MNEVMEFLGDVNKPVAIATIDGDRPRVRFFSFKMLENKSIYFITSRKKNVFKELEKNNKVELCSMPNAESAWIRIDAKVEFIEDVSLNKKAFDLLPLLEKAYQTPENKDIVLLKLIDLDIKKYTLAGNVEEISL